VDITEEVPRELGPGTGPRVKFGDQVPPVREPLADRVAYPPLAQPAQLAQPAKPASTSISSFINNNKGNIVFWSVTGALGAFMISKIVEKAQSEESSHNNTKHTSEAFEGRSNSESVEHALGDHDLDK
jgi:hypothetical protein